MRDDIAGGQLAASVCHVPGRTASQFEIFGINDSLCQFYNRGPILLFRGTNS